MKDYTTLKEYLCSKTQEEFRTTLVSMIRRNPIPMRTLAKDIDISHVTLDNFLSGEDVALVSLSRIEDYIMRQSRYSKKEAELYKNYKGYK